ncbi:hypothetical protein OPQ81_007922 [Rhizoctonia solani]|nr:hypothetical protein OPQ81_007922 [Rhizoctonia solani]
MDVATYVVAPRSHFPRNAEIVEALDHLFREHQVPPAIVQYSFFDRRPANHYNELVHILTPFPTRPTSELLEDIGHAVAPAQARFTTLLGSHYSPVFPSLPAAALYAPPNEEDFVVARSYLRSIDDYTRCIPSGFQSTFESILVIDSTDSGQISSTLRGSYAVKASYPPILPSFQLLALIANTIT